MWNDRVHPDTRKRGGGMRRLLKQLGIKFGGEIVHVGILALQAKGISCFGWELRQKLRVLEYL